MKNQNKTCYFLKALTLFVLVNIFSLHCLNAQSPSIIFQSDTILVGSVAQAKVNYNFTYGVNTNVSVDIFWFVPDSVRATKVFQKELKSVVRKEVRNRFKGVNGYIFVSNYDIDSSKSNINLAGLTGSVLDSGILSRSPVLGFKNGLKPGMQSKNSSGDYLVRAGKSYNTAIGASIFSAVFSAVFFANYLPTAAYFVLGLGTSMAIISNITGNNNLIEAGKSMNQPKKP